MKKKIKQIWHWLDDRTGTSQALESLLKHPVPRGSKWAYVFGSATLFCFVLQVVTGVALALMYQPSADQAFQSLQYITYQAPMGKTLRALHYFGASGMILMAGVHMLRVYLTAAYKFPREMNWISGVLLLLLVMGMGFTGQLMRWDDNGVWSAIVAAEQLGRIPLIGKSLARLLMGGDTLGGQTLSRFFAYHVFIIPGMLFLLIGLHLWLVLRNGISEPARTSRPVDPKTYRRLYQETLKNSGVPFWPYAAWRDALFASLTLIAIISIAVIAGPPALGKQPDPSHVYATPKPDWYLLWLYALYALMPPQIESFAMFFIPIVVIFLLLALPFLSNKGERSPLKRPWAIAGSIAVVTIIGSLLLVGTQANWSANFDAKQLPANIVQGNDSLAMAGKVFFGQKACLYCHKIKGNGGDVGPDLSDIGNRLTESEIRTVIINGKEDMPAYGRSLSASELAALIAFLKTQK